MSIAETTPIGTLLVEEGGYLAGYYSSNGDGQPTHGVILPVKSSGRTSGIFQGVPSTAIATSIHDGAANHAAIVANGETYGAVDWIEANLNDTAYAGFTDWFLPARAQLDIIYWNLKPDGDANNTADQFANPYAVPSRGSDRTSSVPGQTSVAAFQAGATDQEFTQTLFWTSTRDESNTGSYSQDFGGAESGRQLLQTSPLLTGYVTAIRLADVATPPTVQQQFETTYADVSGRDPLPTALTSRGPAQNLVNYLVSIYAGNNPRIVRKPVFIQQGELGKISPAPPAGKLCREIWIDDPRDPNFKGGRKAVILGRSGSAQSGVVELTLFIADNAESFVEPS